MKTVRIVSAVLVAILCFAVASCGKFSEKVITAKELTATVNAKIAEKTDADEEFSLAYDEFAFSFAKTAIAQSETLLFSPFSALACLYMIACGAEGETLDEFNALLGDLGSEKINGVFSSLIEDATESDTVKIADSLWLRESIANPTEDFLSTVKGYYKSEIYSAPFNSQTLKDINGWANNKTKGMIEKIIDDIDPYAIAYIMNALYFESAWKNEYENEDISKRQFTSFDDSVKTVDMMFSSESKYFCVNGADCFEKLYKDDRYSFVGILPREGDNATDWLKNTSGTDFATAYSTAKHAPVRAGIPEFEDASTIEMADGLKSLGLQRVFSPLTAQLDGISKDCYLDFVLQKTKIEVSRKGTKAAAVTIGGMKATSADPESVKSIVLDRPFAYAIMDRTANIPLFIGFINKL